MSIPHSKAQHRALPAATTRPGGLQRAEILVLVAATLVGIGSFLVYLRENRLMEYGDAIAHAQIARRIIDSPTPGISQLGGVWPPLPHLLALPFIWADWLFFSGAGPGLLSVACQVLATWLVFRLARLIGLGTIPSLTAAAVILANPNLRYMQSTGMTELPLIAATVAAVYLLVHWSQTGSLRSFVLLVLSVLAATAIRYEGWVLWGAVLAALALIMLVRRQDRAKTVDYVTYYVVFSSLFIIGWMAWNKIILGTGWLGFLNGTYAEANIWVGANEVAIGHPIVAFKTYWYAMVLLFGQATLVLAVAGLLLFLLRDRLDTRTIGVLVLLFPVPFFTFALFAGQRPMYVPQISGSYYNVRFALQMLPLIALMLGVTVQAAGDLLQHARLHLRSFAPRPGITPRVRTATAGGAVAALALLTVLAAPGTTVVLVEPVLAATIDNRTQDEAIGACLAPLVGSRPRMLMENHGNELALFYSGVDMGNVVYEGSYKLWDDALAHPADYVDWIYMRNAPGREDAVWMALHDNPAALAPFRVVMQTDGAVLYGRTSLVGSGEPSTCTLPANAPPT